MMRRKFAVLQRIDNNCKVTKEENEVFWYHLEQALLLSLREQGRLNPMEHRDAQERLKQQRRNHAKQKQAEP